MTHNISYEEQALSSSNISSGLDGISNLKKDKPAYYKDVYYFEKVNAKSEIDSSCDELTCVVNCSCKAGWNDTVGAKTAQRDYITLTSKINRKLSCTRAVGCDDYGYSYTSCPDGYNCGTAQKPYGTLVCYAKQEAKTCADYGYVDSCPSGQTGTAHSVKLGSTTSTCYSDCKADSYFELTSCSHDSNTQFTVYYKYSTSTDDVIDCRSQDGITGETYSETSASKDNTTGSFIVQFNADCDGTGCEIECGLGKSSTSSIITCQDDSSGGSGNTCHESCISDCEQQYQNSCSWGNATDCQSLANCVSLCGGANSCVGDDCRRYCP